MMGEQDLTKRSARAEHFVSQLQDQICKSLEAFEEQAGSEARFQQDHWQRPGGGGGRSRVLEGGRVFEKAGVNISAVFGEVPEAVAGQMPGTGDTFFATGVSLVLHPRNPHVPTTHANYRYIERGEVGWFGGGADLTPYVLYEEDARHFHQVLKGACDAHDERLYPGFKAWCDKYFWNTHREEARGVGGIFFDHLRPNPQLSNPFSVGDLSMEQLEAFWRSAGEAFLPAYLPIVERRMNLQADEALRQWQLQRRGRYVEFNLLHDRGTKFGLQTNGRIESIFMSLPPLVRWDYAVSPAPDSQEAKLLAILAKPQAWI